MIRILTIITFFAAACSALIAAENKKLTNTDVIKMVKAELPESTIVLAIQNSEPDFDTSPDALIALKEGGVSAAIIEAMLSPAPPATPPPQTAPAPQTIQSPATPPPGFWWGTSLSRVDADRVFLIEGEQRHEMKYTRPKTRSSFRPFGGTQQFAVLGGLKAALRINDPAPEFEMIVPNNVQPTSVIALARLGERRNGTREILIGGGYMSFSAGLPRDRNVELTFEKAPDQTIAPEGYELYRISAIDPLRAAEYAFMVSKGGGEMAGAFGPGAGFSYNFYEFAVD